MATTLNSKGTMTRNKALALAIHALENERKKVAFDRNLNLQYKIQDESTARAVKEYDQFTAAIEILEVLAQEEKNTGRMVVVAYQVKDTWPYSIDQKLEGASVTYLSVPIKETFVKNGKRYYRMVSGHGIYTDLLVEEGS